jgi:hypothetical protein
MGRAWARALALSLAASTCTAALSTAAVPASAQGLWSAPAAVTACADAAQPPRVIFPGDSPTHGTGPGLLAWANGPACPGGEGTLLSAIGPGDVPVAAGRQATAAAPGAVLALRSFALAGAPFGRVVIAGEGTRTGGGAALLEGSAGAPLRAPGVTAGAAAGAAPVLATAYLGDVALALPAQDQGGLRVRVQRWYSHTWGPWRTADAAGAVQAPTLALDYRSDVLAVWQQSGVLYARDLPASGAPGGLQVLARTAPGVHVSALRSDDNRAIVAWSEQRGDAVSVYLDQSGAGVRFGHPQLLERFSAPAGLQAPTSSPALVRLRSESVMLAWAGAAAGRWVIRAAPVDQLGLQTVGTISAPSGSALLAGLAAGPDGGALAVWTEPQPGSDGAPDLDDQAIAAARGIDTYPGVASFGPPEQIAPPGPNTQPSVAFDPGSGRALAVWGQLGGGLRYAVRASGGER